MHELAIARAVIAIAEEQARGRRVLRVEMRVGHLRQVVASALEFSFQAVAMGTCVEGAELAIEEVEVRGRCPACGAESRPRAFPLACERCGSHELEISSGEELLVEALELEEAAAAARGAPPEEDRDDVRRGSCTGPGFE
jgi:hydrogenase nickel incorporation protein HypA/HybF